MMDSKIEYGELVEQAISGGHRRLKFPEVLEQDFIRHHQETMRENLQGNAKMLIVVIAFFTLVGLVFIPINLLGLLPWALAIGNGILFLAFGLSYVERLHPYTEIWGGVLIFIGLAAYLVAGTTVKTDLVIDINMLATALLVVVIYSLFKFRLKIALVSANLSIAVLVSWCFLKDISLNPLLFQATYIGPSVVGILLAYSNEYTERTSFLQAASLNLEKERQKEALDKMNRLSRMNGAQAELAMELGGEKDMETISSKALHFLTVFFNAHVGVMYFFDNESEKLKVTGTYASPSNVAVGDEVELSEGFAGQVARNRKQLLLQDLPDNYFVSSGLGSGVASELLVSPLVHNDRLYGIMELGSLHPFSREDIPLMDSVSENLAIAFFSAETDRKLRGLAGQGG